MTIPIFCINLERATERKENIKKKWIDNLGLNINFWKAYDRRDIENNKFIYSYNKEQIRRRPLSFGELACATSFCMLYEFLIKNNYEEVIIMEDDIIPLILDRCELFDNIKQGKTEFPQADLMLLHDYYGKQGKIINRQKYFSLCDEPPWGNQLFYATKKIIPKLYNSLKTMNFPADYPQKILSKENEIIITNKSLCYHHWTGPNATTYIGNDIRNTHRKFIE
jgi:GR25 family glycosyltransferase involved in LPS biosynthesis